jgi:PepSY-associated TM region
MTIQFRRWLILTHRYLGIVVSVFFVMWFVSGIAMIYARGMPSLTPDMRLERLPELNMGAVKLAPSEAVVKAELGQAPGRAAMLMIMDRPAYRFMSSGGAVTVFADTGELLPEIGHSEAIKIAGSFMELPESKLHYAGELNEADQWTLEERRRLPMHKISVDDDLRTELYISEETGEVELMTTRGSRALAWIAAIPHWMYFAPLRIKDEVWRQVVLWTSGIGGVLAVLGLTLAFTQFSTRYSGLMRWHYVTGTVFGIVTLTWVFSGWLSMEPFFWASGGGTGNQILRILSGGPLDLSSFPMVDAGAWHRVLAARSPKEIEFVRIQSEPYFIARGIEDEPILLSANPLEIRHEPFSVDSLVARIRKGNPSVPITESRLLSDYDSYYHPGERRPPLPVLRVKFGDPDATWFYVDPRMGQVVTRFTRRERLQRWIYHGLHSLDFNFWYYNGPVWRATMVSLNAGGALLSTIGLLLAIKRVKRGTKRVLISRN